jgi:DNA repair protein RecO (recombination protein O)
VPLVRLAARYAPRDWEAGLRAGVVASYAPGDWEAGLRAGVVARYAPGDWEAGLRAGVVASQSVREYLATIGSADPASQSAREYLATSECFDLDSYSPRECLATTLPPSGRRETWTAVDPTPSAGQCYRPVMPVPRRYTTDAIVLSRFDLGEADRVMTLITPGIGKLKAIAKGIRRPTSRIGGSLEPFAELQVALARGRTFDVVTQVSVGHAWLNLRDDLESAATAWYLAELADRSLEERHAAEPLYALLRRAYELLDAGMAPGRVARWYEMHLLDELGVRPEVDRCVECDRVLEAEGRFRWVPPLGGVLCDRCPGPPHDRAGLSLEALKLLKAYQRLDVGALATLRLQPVIERETEAALREFTRQALERDARSLAFLDEIRHAAVPEAH